MQTIMDKTPEIGLGNFIKDAREKVGLTQAQLAIKTRLDVTVINNLENGVFVLLEELQVAALRDGLQCDGDQLKAKIRIDLALKKVADMNMKAAQEKMRAKCGVIMDYSSSHQEHPRVR